MPHSNVVINVENISKQYRLGQIGTGTLSHDLNRWWHRIRGNEDPYLKIGETNDRSKNGNSDYVWALKDISFEVKQGEVLGIIGKNGAGKSTLLKILSRVTTPTSGQIKVKGRIASLLEVGTGFHPELTGRENIFLNGAILGMTKGEIKEKFHEIVAFSEVEKFIDTPVKRYSSGMYVRLAFAVAAHLEPEILIVDEVLAVGDVSFQKKCLGKMGDVAKQGRTILFVSHNMSAVSQLCTDCIWLDQGERAGRSTPSEVISKYLSSLEPEAGDGFITDDMHEHDPKELAFIHVALMEQGGRRASAFYDSPLCFEVTFQVRETVTRGRLGLVIQKLDETVICALHHTNRNDNELLNLSPGNYVARLTVNVSLLPGRYSVAVFAKSEGGYWGSGHSSMDFVKHAMTFDVAEVSRTGHTVFPTGAIILPPSEWSIDSVTRASEGHS